MSGTKGGMNGRSGFDKPDVRPYEMHIYALIDPRTGDVRYVGKSKNAQYRVAGHLSDQAPKRVREWVDELRKNDLVPELRILEVVPPGQDAAWSEGLHAVRFRGTGKLLNRRFPDDRLRGLAWSEIHRLIDQEEDGPTFVAMTGWDEVPA